MKNYTLECCVDSVESALAAEEGGATRLELCASLITGGLSPSLALFREVRKRCSLRVHVLLRPRFGDFLYSEAECAVLREEASIFAGEGADGLVFGCLMPDGALDAERMRRIIERANGLSVTLHRAFDVCADPFAALALAKELGIDTVLTSGQEGRCLDGKPLIQKLLAAAGEGGPDILVGGGVDAGVIAAFLADTSARSFHMSGKTVLESGMRRRNPRVSMGVADLDEYQIWRTDAAKIREAARVLAQNL